MGGFRLGKMSNAEVDEALKGKMLEIRQMMDAASEYMEKMFHHVAMEEDVCLRINPHTGDLAVSYNNADCGGYKYVPFLELIDDLIQEMTFGFGEDSKVDEEPAQDVITMLKESISKIEAALG